MEEWSDEEHWLLARLQAGETVVVNRSNNRPHRNLLSLTVRVNDNETMLNSRPGEYRARGKAPGSLTPAAVTRGGA